MYRHTGFLTMIAGLSFAAMLAPASGCSPSAMPDSTTNPASPQAPSGAAPDLADSSGQQSPDEHADHGEHAGHGAHGSHGAHGGSGAQAGSTEPMGHDHSAHAGHGAQSPSQSADALLAAEQDAYQRAKPVFDKYCAKCHSSAGKKAKKATLDHFSMDTYPFGGHHETEMGEAMRAVLGVAGKRPTMPKDQPGIVRGDELALIVAWSEAFDKSHAAGLHHHGAGHQHGSGKQQEGHQHNHGNGHQHGDH
jgi:hypothetical protein